MTALRHLRSPALADVDAAVRPAWIDAVTRHRPRPSGRGGRGRRLGAASAALVQYSRITLDNIPGADTILWEAAPPDEALRKAAETGLRSVVFHPLAAPPAE